MFLNPFWLIPGFQDFIAPVLALQNSLDILQTFAGFLAKIWIFHHFLHRFKGEENALVTGVCENRKIPKSAKMCLNIPKQSYKVVLTPLQSIP